MTGAKPIGLHDCGPKVEWPTGVFLFRDNMFKPTLTFVSRVEKLSGATPLSLHDNRLKINALPGRLFLIDKIF
jgi:hypothetical protein